MALSRQDIIQLADKIYERGERPSALNLYENIKENTNDKVVSLVEITQGLRLWRAQQFDQNDATISADKNSIDNILKKEIEALNKQLSDKINTASAQLLSHAKFTTGNHEDEIASLCYLIDQIKRQLHNATEELKGLREDKLLLTSQLKESNTELKAVTQQEANLSSMMSTYQTENAELKNKCNELLSIKEDFGIQINQLSSESSQLKNDKANTQTQLNEQKRICEKYQKELEDIQALKHKAELQVSKLEQSTAETLNRFAEINKDRDSALVEVSNVKKLLDTEKRSSQELEKQLAIAETKAEEIQKERDRMNLSLKETKNELKDKSRDLESATIQLTKNENQTISFQNKITAEQTTIEQLKQQISILKTHNDEINKSRSNQESSIKRLENEIASIKEKFHERQQMWIKEKRELSDRLENERRMVNDMKIEVSKSRRP